MLQEHIKYHPKWRIAKYADVAAYAANAPFEVVEFDGNLLLNEGIAELLLLLTGGAATAFSNANARLGVGDSTAAAAAAQTGLQAASNKTYQAMEAGYPQIAAQTVTFRAVFGSAAANHAWQEFTVANGADARPRTSTAR